jgi:hypothetical protein
MKALFERFNRNMSFDILLTHPVSFADTPLKRGIYY